MITPSFVLQGAVWKAIVDHKLMRCGNERFQTDYYKKLLANYNPSRKLTPAAKQIELDLLRTLPNNKHYEGPHADGIAKLRRVLLAYSVHNPDVEYCQVSRKSNQFRMHSAISERFRRCNT